MKRLFLTAALGVGCVSSFAQGTLNFANFGPGLVARAYYSDFTGTTFLSGSGWSADLYWAPGVVLNSASLMALNEPATFSTVPSQAGFFFGGPRTIPGAAGGSTITAQIRVWETAAGSSYAAAAANNSLIGESILFQVVLANQAASPPGIPTTMTALNGHPFGVTLPGPEPSSLALLGLGLAGMLVLRRRPTCAKQSGLNYPAATNPAMTTQCHTECKLRRFVDRNLSATL